MILLVAGTRPEVIKQAPVFAAMRAAGMDVEWLWTGQSPDLEDTFEAFDVKPRWRIEWASRGNTLGSLTAKLHRLLEQSLGEVQPDLVVVQGDTLSAAVACQQAFLAGIPTAHVEAGLRSWDVYSPFPEEACRLWIDAVADLKFAPTAGAAENLRGPVLVTGNTSVDACMMVREARPVDGKYAVVTMHRRENADGVVSVCRAMKRLLADGVFEKIVWPVHPNPIVANVVPQEMIDEPGCVILPPVPYSEMVNLTRNAKMVFTDSGGMQEDSLTLGVPCLVMRNTTERPEGVETGGAVLVGTDTERIVKTAEHVMGSLRVWGDMVTARNPYGDGHAGERIAAACRAFLEGGDMLTIEEWTG